MRIRRFVIVVYWTFFILFNTRNVTWQWSQTRAASSKHWRPLESWKRLSPLRELKWEWKSSPQSGLSKNPRNSWNQHSTPRFNNKIRKQLTKLGSDCTVESEDKIDDTMALVILVDPGKSLVKTTCGRILQKCFVTLPGQTSHYPAIWSCWLIWYCNSMLVTGQYRTIDDLVRNETQGGGSMELISLKEIRDGEEKIE